MSLHQKKPKRTIELVIYTEKGQIEKSIKDQECFFYFDYKNAMNLEIESFFDKIIIKAPDVCDNDIRELTGWLKPGGRMELEMRWEEDDPQVDQVMTKLKDFGMTDVSKNDKFITAKRPKQSW